MTGFFTYGPFDQKKNSDLHRGNMDKSFEMVAEFASILSISHLI